MTDVAAAVHENVPGVEYTALPIDYLTISVTQYSYLRLIGLYCKFTSILLQSRFVDL